MNKKYITLLMLLATLDFNAVFGQDNQEWKNYKVFQVNAEYPHASFMSCKTQEEALKYPYLPASG